MSQPHVLYEVATYGIQAGFWAAVLFPVVTALYWPWWQHQWGWTVVALDSAIALALLGDILVVEFGMKPGSEPGYVFEWVEVVALWLIPVIIAWRAVLTFVIQWRARDSGAGPGGTPTPPEGVPAAD